MEDPNSDKTPVSAIVKGWRQFLRVSAPESAWIAELRRDARLTGMQDHAHWLSGLRSSNLHKRQWTRRGFDELPAVNRRLITVLAYQIAVKQISDVLGTSFLICLAGLIMTCMIAPYLLAVTFFIIMMTAIIVHTAMRSSITQELMYNLLDSSNDPRLIPFLVMRLNTARSSDTPSRYVIGGRSIRNALVRLLPLVQEEDAAEWTGMHWRCLLDSLKHPYIDIELTLAVLDVCARVGNFEARVAVENLTSLPPILFSPYLSPMRRATERVPIEANISLIQERAQFCLPLLEARLERQRLAMTLLRPSDQASATASDILLRPSLANGSETPAEQLLRPHSGE